MLVFAFIVPHWMPWEEIQHPLLAYSCLVGSVSSWIGSATYHVFMTHANGEPLYVHLLQWDVVGIWVTQALGAATTIYTSVHCYSDTVRLTMITCYVLASVASLRDSLTARSAWSRILGFASLFLLRIIAFGLRVADPATLSGGSVSPLSATRTLPSSTPLSLAYTMRREQPLIHVVMQEAWAVVGSVISATRVPERWFPGSFDYLFNSHNVMHVFVVLGAWHMVAAARADLLWLATGDACSRSSTLAPLAS